MIPTIFVTLPWTKERRQLSSKGFAGWNYQNENLWNQKSFKMWNSLFAKFGLRINIFCRKYCKIVSLQKANKQPEKPRVGTICAMTLFGQSGVWGLRAKGCWIPRILMFLLFTKVKSQLDDDIYMLISHIEPPLFSEVVFLYNSNVVCYDDGVFEPEKWWSVCLYVMKIPLHCIDHAFSPDWVPQARGERV